jgi:RimJ/RimL family protein N-acetyltransferase
MDIAPITLQGGYIQLEPLSLDEHLDDLVTAGAHPELFNWFSEDHSSPDAMRAFVEDAITAKDCGTALPFAIVLQDTEEAIGSTRFGNIVPEHRRVEIGWTWITPSQQRTPANTEAKYLMLMHAFEEWDCVRIELKTDTRNQRSIDAIQRIGATEEGVLRKHMQTHQGTRDTVYFSILNEEWPTVKSALKSKLPESGNSNPRP